MFLDCKAHRGSVLLYTHFDRLPQSAGEMNWHFHISHHFQKSARESTLDIPGKQIIALPAASDMDRYCEQVTTEVGLALSVQLPFVGKEPASWWTHSHLDSSLGGLPKKPSIPPNMPFFLLLHASHHNFPLISYQHPFIPQWFLKRGNNPPKIN